MPDEKKPAAKPKKPQPIRLGPAIHLTLSDAQAAALRDASKETGIPQATILEHLRATVEPTIANVQKALRGLDIRTIAVQMKLDELETWKAKIAELTKRPGGDK